MSAGISTMYRMSGGCTVTKRCTDCRYLEEESERVRFGKTHEYYRCEKHPDRERTPDWKPTYTACRYYDEPGGWQIFKESETGQLFFMT